MSRDKELFLIDKQGVYTLSEHHVLCINSFSGCMLSISNEKTKEKSVLYYKNQPGSAFDLELNDFVKKYVRKCKLQSPSECSVKFVSSGFYMHSLEAFLKAQNIEFKGKSITSGDQYEVFFYVSTNKLRIAKTIHDDVHDEEEFIKVLIIDDSQTIRKILVNSLETDKKFKVVAELNSADKAIEVIAKENPDVITLDIDMPGKSGVELLKEYYPKYEIPTIMITSMDITDGSNVLESLENGAIDYMQKPTLKNLGQLGPILREKVLIASRTSKRRSKTVDPLIESVPESEMARNFKLHDGAIIAVGASTGGTEAIKTMLSELPENIPPILISQHIPAYFSHAFAERLDNLFKFKVKEAEDNELILPGVVYIAPGGKHMGVEEEKGQNKIVIHEDDIGSNHSPSIDYLFHTVSKLSKNAIGVILTGMGSDGAKGLLSMKENGCYTIAQDENSSVVWGMPKVACEIGAADSVLDLSDISKEIVRQIKVIRKVS